MGVLLEAKSLKKSFYNFKNFKYHTIVKDVSLTVNEGEIVGILGPNGAGKSTSLKMISGDHTPDEGSIFFDGKDVTDWPMYKRCNAGLGYMAQDNTLFKQLSVENNLIGIMQMQGFSKQECRQRCDDLMELFNLKHIRHTIAARISGGEKRRLEVARALTKRPKMLILDEPFAGVDPIVIQAVQDLVVELIDKWGISILITDHSVPNIVGLIDRCYVIAEGRVIFNGDVNDMVNDQLVQNLYLGDNALSQVIAYDQTGRRVVKSRRRPLKRDQNPENIDVPRVYSDQDASAFVPHSGYEQPEINASADSTEPTPERTPEPSDEQLNSFNNIPAEEELVNETSLSSPILNEVANEEYSFGENSAPEENQIENSEQTDTDLSQLLQPVQTNDYMPDYPPKPSATLADFMTETPPAPENGEPTPPAQQRKSTPPGPNIKPFRRKK